MATCTYAPGTTEQEICLLRDALGRTADALAAERGGSDWLAAVESLSQAAVNLMLPLAAITLVVLLYRPLRAMIGSRQFAIKIAGVELSVQQASEQIGKQLSDLQAKVAELEAAALAAGTHPATKDTTTEGYGTSERDLPGPLSILWVDDTPANNAFEVSGLRDAGHRIDQVTSTEAALSRLEGGT